MWVSVVREHELYESLVVFKELLEESEYKKYVPENVEDILKSLIEKETVLSLKNEEGKIVGLLAYTIYDNPFILFKKKFAQELVWCVLKPYRKHSKMLVEFYESQAKEKGCTSVMLAAMVSKKSPVIERLYNSLGYNKSEEFFEKELS